MIATDLPSADKSLGSQQIILFRLKLQTPVIGLYHAIFETRGGCKLTCCSVASCMQATGMVNDHVQSCFRCDEVRAMGGR